VIFNEDFNANLEPTVSVKVIRKSVNILWSYDIRRLTSYVTIYTQICNLCMYICLNQLVPQ